MSFAERLLRRRQGLNDIVGFNGGTLQDQLDEDRMGQSPDRMSGVPSNQVAQQPQQPTMADRYMATAQPVEPNAPTANTVNPFQQRLMSGRQRIANPTEFDTQHLRDLESQKDPRWERILNAAAAGVTSAAQGGAPIKAIPTRRERDIGRVEKQIGRDIALDRNRIMTEQGQLVPFTLPDGSTTMVPAKTVGSLASRQQSKLTDQADRRRMNDEHVGRWHQMARNERAKQILDEYKTGGLNGNPELLDQASRELGLAGTLKDKFIAGQFRGDIDGNGNLIEVNQQTGTATPITQLTQPPQPPTANPSDAMRPRTATAPVQSFKVTQEAAKDERSRLNRAAAMDRAVVMARATSARMGDPAEYENLATQAEKDAADAAAQAKEVGPRRATPYLAEEGRAKARATQLRELATKARGGQSLGAAQPSAPTRQFNEKAFKSAFAIKNHRQPTEAEINLYRNAP
jgi:hypothetical protein